VDDLDTTAWIERCRKTRSRYIVNMKLSRKRDNYRLYVINLRSDQGMIALVARRSFLDLSLAFSAPSHFLRADNVQRQAGVFLLQMR